MLLLLVFERKKKGKEGSRLMRDNGEDKERAAEEKKRLLADRVRVGNRSFVLFCEFHDLDDNQSTYLDRQRHE